MEECNESNLIFTLLVTIEALRASLFSTLFLATILCWSIEKPLSLERVGMKISLNPKITYKIMLVNGESCPPPCLLIF